MLHSCVTAIATQQSIQAEQAERYSCDYDWTVVLRSRMKLRMLLAWACQDDQSLFVHCTKWCIARIPQTWNATPSLLIKLFPPLAYPVPSLLISTSPGFIPLSLSFFFFFPSFSFASDTVVRSASHT